jgi:transcriptional regulator with XRE-family HTH domain
MEDMTHKIRTLREIYGYSQEAVAYQIGISQAAYCRRESGKTRFTFECIQHLAQLYQVSLMDLLNNSVEELALQAFQKNRSNAA